MDAVDSASARPAWLAQIGGHYIDGRKVPADQIGNKIGPMDLIVEASGIHSLEFQVLTALAPNGAYVITGIPGGEGSSRLPGPA